MNNEQKNFYYARALAVDDELAKLLKAPLIRYTGNGDECNKLGKQYNITYIIGEECIACYDGTTKKFMYGESIASFPDVYACIRYSIVQSVIMKLKGN